MIDIILYSKTGCVQCNFVKHYLDERGARYWHVDVTNDEEALNHIKQLGFQTVPVVEAKGHEPFFGFRPEKLDEILEGKRND